MNKTSKSGLKEHVDLILSNAKVYTVDSTFRIVNAVAVKDGKFVAAGSNEEILNRFHGEKMIDAKGLPVYPGFIDAHCHFYGYARYLRQVDLTGSKSFKEVIDRLKSYAKETSSTWLVGRGWDQNLWEKKSFPDRKDLDSLFPERPVVLIRVDGHSVLANGKALELSGIKGGKDFLPGEVNVKDGWLTGLISENAADKVKDHIPVPDRKHMISLLEKAQQNCFAVGLTTVADAGLEYDVLRLIDSLQKAGRLKMRIYAMLGPSASNIRYFLMKGVYKTDFLTIRSVKLYSDGSLGSRTALLKKPYTDDPGKTGILVTPLDSIRRICRLALEHGYQVNTHAIGDSAVSLILSVYGEFLKGKNDKRWRIEHAQVVDPKDLQIFKKYSVIPSIQATHATSDMYWAANRLGKERIQTAYAYHDLLIQNGWLANGTDFPIENISPLLTFYAAVARKDLKGWPEKGFQPGNALSREEALRSITIWAAKSCFEESEKGSIEPGKWADFVILDKDIMMIHQSELPELKVLKTFVGGLKVYEKP